MSKTEEQQAALLYAQNLQSEPNTYPTVASIFLAGIAWRDANPKADPKDVATPHRYHLVMTCGACPEQYDVHDANGETIAYLRLRHGHFTVSCPYVGGELVYSAITDGDGSFTDSERPGHIRAALDAIHKHQIDKT